MGKPYASENLTRTVSKLVELSASCLSALSLSPVGSSAGVIIRDPDSSSAVVLESESAAPDESLSDDDDDDDDDATAWQAQSLQILVTN